ncbi:hypothetical protein HC761_01475 [bacterium]|nr:hypothetical protein [bacterium]
MAPKLLSWLEAGLVSGKLVSGQAILRAPLKPKQFPFAAQQGVLAAQFELADSTIKFAPDWPAAVIAGQFAMRNGSLRGHTLRGQIADNQITAAAFELMISKRLSSSSS